LSIDQVYDALHYQWSRFAASHVPKYGRSETGKQLLRLLSRSENGELPLCLLSCLDIVATGIIAERF
jgi:hypothetical protein